MDSKSSDSGPISGPDYNYILNMSLWSLTKEKVDELIKQRDSKGKELSDLKKKPPSDLWREDLAAFAEELDRVEAQEKEDSLAGFAGKAIKGKVGKPKIKKLQLEETMPSPFGRRIVPEVTSAMKADASKKLLKKKKVDSDSIGIKLEFDDEFGGMLADGGADDSQNTTVQKSPKPKRVKKEPGTRVRRTPQSSKSSGKKVKKRNPWSDDDAESESDLEESEPVVIPRDSLLRRAAAERPKYTFDFSEEEDADDDDDDDDNVSNTNHNNLDDLKVKASPVINNQDDDDDPSDSLYKEDEDFPPVKSKPSSEKSSQEKKDKDFGDLFSFSSYSQKSGNDITKLDSDGDDSGPVYSSSFVKSAEKAPSKTVATKKAKLSLDTPKPKRATKSKKTEPVHSDSDSEFGLPSSDTIPKSKRPTKPKMTEPVHTDSDSEFGLPSSDTIPKSKRPTKPKMTEPVHTDSDSEFGFLSSETTPKPKRPTKPKKTEPVHSDSDLEFGFLSSETAPKPKRPPKSKKADLVNVESDLEFGMPKKAAAPKGKGRGRKRKQSDSENEGEYTPAKKQARSSAGKVRTQKSKKVSTQHDSDGDIFPSDFVSENTSRQQPGRARKEVKYFVESDDEDDFDMF
ncbi:DNA topoisomerase 2-beta-like [Microcaecilia unicolor]|uniref:DNA topoisomerase 2-beta-like n=1 Tax=Microcaecilia unicolor TaxID=1415580 RepID=A0A6P7WTQ7_9AMPH|nr:DNA topoisomerase 2-beta-like [Microcaecilia unicolor]